MIGNTISHYRILQKIGSGGMGEVFLAEDTKLDRKVALKFLPVQFSADEEERKRFVHEAKAASALDHPNICSVYEIGETPEGQLFIAMGYYAGKTLKEKIKNGPLPIPEATEITIQLAEGLKKAHSKGIIHRDLKPANVMLTDDGMVKIVDFGLAKLKGLTRLTKSGTTLGTVAYMSPEQAQGKEVDQRSDIWSLGVILYEMLTGKLPFNGEYDQAMLYAVINEEPESLSKLRSDLPDELRRIILKTLAKSPENRYQTATEFLKEMKPFHQNMMAPEAVAFNLRRFLFRLQVIVPIFLLLCLIILTTVFYLQHQTKVNWARNELLPRITRMSELPEWLDYVKIFELAVEAEKFLPGDSKLAAIFKKFSTQMDILTDPPGAKVYVKYYHEPEKEWRYAGISPIKKLRVPGAFLRLKMEKEGYETVQMAAASFKQWSYHTPVLFPGEISGVLDKQGTLPAGMVRVKGGKISGIGELEDFFIDRFEVTNRQYREFVLKGGYQKRDHWKHVFNRDGKTLTWEQAMAAFVDRTGLPGPATWQAGDYPEGEDDLPVSGISWYEAAAYADFVGKTLPSRFHWSIAKGDLMNLYSSFLFYPIFYSQSNFHMKGPEPVGSNPAITSYELYDMAGNVREWCFNETRLGRLVRGGAWEDVPYMFTNASQLSPFDRSPKNGFRCSLYIHPEKVPQAALARVEIANMRVRDYQNQKPVSDSIYRVYPEQYAYDKIELDPKLEIRDDTAKEWIVEKVSFAAAYENERVPAFLYLPKTIPPPFQTIVFFPGSQAARSRSSQSLARLSEQQYLSPLVKNGRAVMFPIYKGTYERGSDSLAAIHDGVNTRQYTEYFIKVVKDFRRSIDYLETRPDIDSNKLAYFGFSWGGTNGAIITAVEDRLKASILNVGGWYGTPRPEVDGINYITRVKIPTLMLNGKYDMIYQFEPMVKPMFDLLATPAADKRLIVYNTDHIIPITEFIRETIKWLDKYLGPVKR